MPVLVLTRAAAASQAFADAVSAVRADIHTVISPALRIEPIDQVELPAASHLIFTSVNGVLWAKARGLRANDVWCVGDRTAEAAKDLGQVHSASGRASDLAKLIIDAAPNGHMLHLVGDHQHGDLAADLRAGGVACDARVVYRQTVQSPSPELLRALGGTNPLVAPVFSARSALVFEGTARQAPLYGVAISADVATALRDLKFDAVTTAVLPNAAAMKDATLNVLSDVSQSRI